MSLPNYLETGEIIVQVDPTMSFWQEKIYQERLEKREEAEKRKLSGNV